MSLKASSTIQEYCDKIKLYSRSYLHEDQYHTITHHIEMIESCNRQVHDKLLEGGIETRVGALTCPECGNKPRSEIEGEG